MTPTWIWHELMTIDTAAGAEFYSKLLGLKAEAWADPAMNYTMFSSASGGMGGVAELPAEARAMGAPPHWMGVVGVASAANTIARAAELGGTLVAGPMPVPGVGIYAVLADPTGAAFSIMQSDSADSGPTPDPKDLGRVSWNELWSSDPEKAWAFYSELFGWVETGTMDMGPGGLYRMYGTTREGQSLGGLAQKMPEQPVSAWAFYFNVANADAALQAATGLGGKPVMGPMDVPGGGRIAMAVDPQGAHFAVYSHAEPSS